MLIPQIFPLAPVSPNQAALSKQILPFLQPHFPQSNFTVHVSTKLLIPNSASQSSCPPLAQMRQIMPNTWEEEEWEQLRFCPTESSSFMIFKSKQLGFPVLIFFFLSHNSSNLSAMNKPNQHCGVPLYALNVSFPLQKVSSACCVVVSYVLYIFVMFYIVWCCLFTSLQMEILDLLLRNRAGLCDLFSHISAGLMLNLTKIRYLYVHKSSAYIIIPLSAEGPNLESKIFLRKMLLN